MTKRCIMLGLVVIAALAAAVPAQAQSFVVIAHPDAGFDAISSNDLSKIFQKKSRNLPGGTSAQPIDLDKSSSVREAFSQAIHGRGTSAIESYWQQQIFSGRDVPPETRASDAEIIAFVASTPGAIGYVSAGASLSGVKQITVN